MKIKQMTDNQEEKVKRLASIMQEKNIKQKDMADLIGLKASNLSSIMKNKENRELPYGTSYILQIELGVSRIWFDTGEGDMLLRSSKETDNPGGAHNEQEIVYLKKLISSMEMTISSQEQTIMLLKQQIADKSTENDLAAHKLIQGQLEKQKH